MLGVISHYDDAVKSCLEKRLAHDANLAGLVRIEFTIADTGHVTAFGVKSSMMNSPAVDSVERCLTAAVLRWEFPRSQGGGHVVVTYPVIQKSAPPGPG